MERGELFGALVDYHCSVNLRKALPRIRNGVLANQRGAIPEGSDVSCPYSGVLIVANGSHLAERLLQDRVVGDDEISGFKEIPTKTELSRYLPQKEAEDGAYVFDGTKSRMTHVQELNNSPPGLPADFVMYHMVPANFFYASGQGPRPKIGTKTRLAIKLPHAYHDTETFQIKRSRYGPLGMGKVTHFTIDGLVEEFLFEYDPTKTNPDHGRRSGIAGKIRTYQRNDSGLYLASEQAVNLDQYF